MAKKIHSHRCVGCKAEWVCKDPKCPLHGEDTDATYSRECEKCERAETTAKHTETQKKNEVLPTRPTNAAMDETGVLLKEINAKLGYKLGDRASIDTIDPQEWVNLFHKYRVVYQQLHAIGDLLRERKIIVRLESERDYQHKKKENKKAAARKLGTSVKKSPADKQRDRLRSLGVSDDEIEKIIEKIMGKAKG